MSKAGVEVMTWGTEMFSPEDPGSDGMQQFVGTMMWGGNVGHAALKLTIPNTQENRKLIKEHLKGTGIPHKEKTYETKMVEIDPKTNKPKLTDKTAHKEEVIEIYFSYWPSSTEDEKGFSFNEFHEDTSAERTGVDMPYSASARDYLRPEERRVTGGILSRFASPRTVSLDLQHWAHMNGRTVEEQSVLNNNQQTHHLTAEISNIQFAISRLQEKHKNYSQGQEMLLSQTEKNMVKRFFPEENVHGRFDAQNLQRLITQLTSMQNDLMRGQIFAWHDYAQSLITLNGGMEKARVAVVMSEDEKSAYQKVQNTRDLYMWLKSFDPSKPEGIEEFNRKILGGQDKEPPHPAYASGVIKLFKDGVKSEKQCKQLLSALERELDPNSNGLIASNKGAVKKGDLNQFYESLDTIGELKDLKAQLDNYANAKGKPEEAQERAKLIDLMVTIKDRKVAGKEETFAQNLCKRMLPLRDEPAQQQDDLKYMQECVAERLDPLYNEGKRKNVFAGFVSVVNSKGNMIFETLSEPKAQSLFESSISLGHPPSGIVNLPLEDKANGRPGLSTDAMLKEMGRFVREAKKFNIVNHNCSVSCSQILAVGAGDRGHIFQQAAWSDSVYNPQVVFNNAVQFSGSKPGDNPNQQSYAQAAQTYLAQTFVQSAANIMRTVDDPEMSRTQKAVNIGYELGKGGTAATWAAGISATRAAGSYLSSFIWSKEQTKQANTAVVKSTDPKASQPSRESNPTTKPKI